MSWLVIFTSLCHLQPSSFLFFIQTFISCLSCRSSGCTVAIFKLLSSEWRPPCCQSFLPGEAGGTDEVVWSGPLVWTLSLRGATTLVCWTLAVSGNNPSKHSLILARSWRHSGRPALCTMLYTPVTHATKPNAITLRSKLKGVYA